MPFLTYVCKNPTPHKTIVFVPATVIGSASPGQTGGNQGAIVPAGQLVGAAAIFTCPKCAFTTQAGDGNMSSVANGLQSGNVGMNQESAIGNQNEANTDQGVQEAPVVAGTTDSAIRLTATGGGVGNPGGAGILGAGSTQYNLNQAGVKNLL